MAGRADFLEYKEAKERFVTGHKGTTLLEVTLLGLIFPASLLLLQGLDAARCSARGGCERRHEEAKQPSRAEQR